MRFRGGIFDCDLRSRDDFARRCRCGARNARCGARRCHCVARRTRFLARRRHCGARRRQGCGNVVWRCRISPAKLRISVHVASSSPCFSEKCSFFCVFGGFGRGFLCARGGSPSSPPPPRYGKNSIFEPFFGDSTLTFLTSGNTFRLPILPTRRIVLLRSAPN